ncbi:hypothetical protein Cabther_A0140 [Chloracidobacterium thermophilum B]|uniref:Uncharacterized protein n=2 Tax=Chloracidobacterium thermophilum TaxID=458033 RepID=G2LGF3_CHLTF|nr:hypothetical protein Cabther_A0140 [Chloracidobacterium thermophilum B]
MLNFLVVGQRIYKRQALDSDIFLATVSVVYFAAVIRRLNQTFTLPLQILPWCFRSLQLLGFFGLSQILWYKEQKLLGWHL